MKEIKKNSDVFCHFLNSIAWFLMMGKLASTFGNADVAKYIVIKQHLLKAKTKYDSNGE
jgi:hypothetical protein